VINEDEACRTRDPRRSGSAKNTALVRSIGRADAARERDAQAAACAAQLHAVQALADTWRARAEHAEQQLSLERDHQRRLAAQPLAATDPATAGGMPAARTTTRPAATRATRAAAGGQP
jgi:hypothetical protein